MNVHGPPCVGVVAPWIGAGLDGLKAIIPIRVGEGAPASGEVRIKRCVMLFDFMPVAAGGIGLPNFHKSAGNRAAVFVENVAMHVDAFADRVSRVLRGQVMVFGADDAVAEDRAGALGECARQRYQRLARRPQDRGLVRREVKVGLCPQRGGV